MWEPYERSEPKAGLMQRRPMDEVGGLSPTAAVKFHVIRDALGAPSFVIIRQDPASASGFACS